MFGKENTKSCKGTSGELEFKEKKIKNADDRDDGVIKNFMHLIQSGALKEVLNKVSNLFSFFTLKEKNQHFSSHHRTTLPPALILSISIFPQSDLNSRT